MAEIEKDKNLKDFAEFIDRFNEASELVKRQKEDDRTKVRDEVKAKIPEYVYNGGLEHGFISTDRFPSKESLTGEQIQELFPQVHGRYSQKASNILYNDADSVIDNLPEKGLEVLLGNKDFVGSPQAQKYGDLFRLYHEQKYFENLAKKVDEDKLDEKDLEILVKERKESLEELAEVAGKAAEKRLKDEGASLDYQEFAYIFNKNAILNGKLTKESLQEGANELAKKRKTELENYNVGDEKLDIYTAVRKSLKEMAKDDDTDTFNAARNFVYGAYKNAAE